MLSRLLRISTTVAAGTTERRATNIIQPSQGIFSRLGDRRRNYHEKVIDHYERPRNVGSLDKNDPQVGTGLVGAPACGDVMKLQIRVSDAGIIEDVRFKTFGCGSAIASSSLATEWIRGRTVEEAQSIKNTDIARELCLPPVKLHCSMLAEDAIKSAVRDWQQKSGRLVEQVDLTATTDISEKVAK